MTAVLVLVEHDRGVLAEPSLEALVFGRRLGERLGLPLQGVLVGSEARPLTEGLARFGVSTVHLAEHPLLEDYGPEAWAASLLEAIDAVRAPVAMAAGTDRGHEVMAHAAARTELPLAADCTEVRPGEPFSVTRLRWGGSLLEEATVDGAVKLLTVAPHAVRAEESPQPGRIEVRSFTPSISDKDLRVRVVGRVEKTAAGVSLAEARVVVGGGRGVGGAQGFAPLEELAGLLGGAVGCSRVVTSLGWRPHADQIGQTGTRIAPDLYIACGISGAIQHMVGCRSAKRLLAINTDPEAPIMAQADYALIGDLHAVLPTLNAEVRRIKAGR